MYVYVYMYICTYIYTHASNSIKIVTGKGKMLKSSAKSMTGKIDLNFNSI